MSKDKKERVSFLEHTAYKLRYWSIVMTGQAGSGHPTSALSAADLVAVIFFYTMHFDPYNYENKDNDRFILSKGHAAPLLYAVWHELGLISEQELRLYRHIDSSLEGHPTRRFAYAEAATGSLGIGLSVGVGQALAAKLDNRHYRTYVVMGDGEVTEGSVWEAVQIAAHYKLDNLVCCIDANSLGQTTETLFHNNIEEYATIFTSFGWHVFVVDGHSIPELTKVMDEVQRVEDKPIMIIAKTIKGYGIDFAANRQALHGKAFVDKQEALALEQLRNNFLHAAEFDESTYQWEPLHPHASAVKNRGGCEIIQLPEPAYSHGEMIATRKAYGVALAHLADACDSIVCLDAEVKNSTYADIFESIHTDRFFQCFIAEQNMVGMGIGFERRGKIPFISTFSSFFSRAHDQIRMAAISQSALRLVGSHAGVSVGEDGPSQMGLEDIAMMRCLPESIVLYPCDAVSTHKLVEKMARYNQGVSYLRTTRMATPVIYDNNAEFHIGGCNVLRCSENDVLCLIGAGVTLFESLKAYDILAQENIFVSVIDLYSIKPVDVAAVKSVAISSNKKIIVIEDHYPEGGIADAVRTAVSDDANICVYSLAIRELPRSGSPSDLLKKYGIDADSIVKKVKESM